MFLSKMMNLFQLVLFLSSSILCFASPVVVIEVKAVLYQVKKFKENGDTIEKMKSIAEGEVATFEKDKLPILRKISNLENKIQNDGKDPSLNRDLSKLRHQIEDIEEVKKEYIRRALAVLSQKEREFFEPTIKKIRIALSELSEKLSFSKVVAIETKKIMYPDPEYNNDFNKTQLSGNELNITADVVKKLNKRKFFRF